MPVEDLGVCPIRSRLSHARTESPRAEHDPLQASRCGVLLCVSIAVELGWALYREAV